MYVQHLMIYAIKIGSIKKYLWTRNYVDISMKRNFAIFLKSIRNDYNFIIINVTNYIYYILYYIIIYYKNSINY